MDQLSTAQARRIALAAQGFLDPRPEGATTRRHLRRVLDRTGLLQIDSVNVLARAHYLPVLSRLGPYSTDLLDTASYARPRLLFEYWSHVAALTPVEMHPLLRWRMAEAERNVWTGIRRIVRESPDLVAWVRDEVAARGPVTSAEIEGDLPRPAKVDWGWNWSDVKTALEWLFRTGEVAVAGRTNAFARVYDRPERVLPRAVLDAPTPGEAEAFRELVRISARALGVAAEPELRDYFRLTGPRFTQALRELVEEGALVPVTVPGWRRAYLYVGARLPRRVDVAALVSPFDPLVWERGRTQRLFDFHYRIGIYTVPHERQHGYYALPFLLGDTLVARVDLKADRRAGVLLVPGAWAEPGQDVPEIAERLRPVLAEVAAWLGLSAVAPQRRGDLGTVLASAQAGRRGVTVVG
ncbi:MAG TPA: crosslink repair DNA glycosylase YcaQ family protein [Micromonosporaceae bacterium]|jgi:hypothetical protein